MRAIRYRQMLNGEVKKMAAAFMNGNRVRVALVLLIP